MNKEIQKITTSELVQMADGSLECRETASWLIKSREEALIKGKFPTPEDLAKHKLTSTQWSLLTGFSKTLPGGAASPIFLDVIAQTFAEFGPYLEDRVIELRPVIHTSAVSQGICKDWEAARLSEQLSKNMTGVSGGMFSHLNTLHYETCCAIGNAPQTRDLLYINLERFFQCDRLGAPLYYQLIKTYRPQEIRIRPFEAVIGKRHPEVPLNNIGAFDVNCNRNVSFFENPPRNLKTSIEDPDLREGGWSYQELNDDFQKSMNQGVLILPIHCIDIRTAMNLPQQDENGGNLINIELLSKQINSLRNPLARYFNPTYTSFGALSHAELPLGVVLSGTDERMLRLAYLLHRYDEAILISGKHLKHSRPMVLSLPSELHHTKAFNILTNQLNRLLTNLDGEIYRDKWGINPPRAFLKTEEETFELTPDKNQNGLIFALPNSENGRALAQLVKPRLPCMPNSYIGNPPIELTYPCSTRSLGFFI